MMKKAWWKEAVVYQVYPRSFMDSNGDGIGDLRGVINKLDYIRDLGADVIWLNPIYKSPNDDNGYDISDYRDIMDEFGTMGDFDELLEKAHEKGLRIMMDLVVNHTSDEHPWFIESRSSKDNPYRDYYIWRQGKEDGTPPNNWGSCFSGSAWQKCEETGEYYLHLFSVKQPDLNWENEKVRREVYDLMRFWLDKGVDGFRMDVINYISKAPGLPDGPRDAGALYGNFGPFCANGPRIHEFLKEMNREVLSHYDIITVGEMPDVTIELSQQYTGEDEDELQMVFQFEHMGLDRNGPMGRWSKDRAKLSDLRRCLSAWQTGLSRKGWNSLYWNNHDPPRVVSRFGCDTSEEMRVRSAKMLGTLLHMLKGTPYIYQGEELGMTNVRFASIDDYRDIESLNAWKEMTQQCGVSEEKMLSSLHWQSRDNARTPMQWDDTENAGFTAGTPWIGVNPNYHTINVQAQLKDENSVYSYYKKLIALRKTYPIIVYGDSTLLLPDDEQIFAYQRTLEGQKLLILCNYSGERTKNISLHEWGMDEAQLLLSNMSVKEDVSFSLEPYEARVYLMQ